MTNGITTHPVPTPYSITYTNRSHEDWQQEPSWQPARSTRPHRIDLQPIGCDTTPRDIDRVYQLMSRMLQHPAFTEDTPIILEWEPDPVAAACWVEYTDDWYTIRLRETLTGRALNQSLLHGLVHVHLHTCGNTFPHDEDFKELASEMGLGRRWLTPCDCQERFWQDPGK